MAKLPPERRAALALERLAVELMQYRPEEARAHGLSNQHLIILASVCDQPGCGVTAISAQSGIFQSTVSRSLGSLFKKELVYKRTSASDTRASELYLTEEGHKIVVSIRTEWRQRVTTMLASVPEGDRETLLKGLQVLVGVVHHLTEPQSGDDS
ncbi:MAG: MarR family winged helix-turn-helix transcriptional regulator [Pseudomonadota bacterium]